MRKNVLASFVFLGLVATSFTSAEATEITGVSKFATTSQMMSGMKVKVTFADESTPWTGTWANIPSTSNSGVSDSDWYFINTPYSSSYNDTYWNYWTLSTSKGITSITINGIIADTMFDIWGISQGKGTDDSEYGKLKLADGWSYSVSDAINLPLAAAVGDLWGSLTLYYGTDYTNPSVFTGIASFQLDTDKTLASETPEPATMILFGAGLAGFGLYRRKKVLKK
jgi:hypothetical protein